MNNTFNISRFGMLLRRQWQEFGMIYLISLLVAAGAIICLYAFNIPEPRRGYEFSGNFTRQLSFREPIFLCLGFLFITVISSAYFSVMGQKPRATIELMIPCSKLEKFLGAIFFTSLLSIFSYLLIFYLTDAFFMNYLRKGFEGTILPVIKTEKVLFTPFFSLYKGEIYTYPFWVLPFAFSSLFLLGSIYFNRFHYIKTAVSVMIFSGGITYILYKISRFLMAGKFRIRSNEELNNISRDEGMWYLVGILSLLTLILWFIGYVRLKEKEV